ncbi:pyridoxal phosphate-dependent aminotransferase [Haemophilus paracuniculus]|uniref:Pyridoxal phosphate-dependent aminotransferase n=1 Tax=Haemophilus paracuniculus TaxID=734 RepID=A0A1T0AU03_9PAST|nr:aminotransferase class I/II-fold pyridoxal phosphate-dependent enzyme [Haemophilus paracuniculus]OOR99852.1 pyridoxal phosphate-dependent aminotransferase [Haemophilus paracuniculus]
MSIRIYLSSPHMGGNELNYIHEAFEQNWIAPLGPNVNNFEQKLETFLGDNTYVSALSAGTAALHLALVQCDVQKNDVVICQSMTFAASANPIVYLGATPVFVDSEEDTWNICPESLEKAILGCIEKGKKPKAIIAVHLYGMPFKADKIEEICAKYDIPLIEDAAEALGSTYKGKQCGTFGKFGVLSFNGNKIITTSGGGALVCHSQQDKQKTTFLSTQARDNTPHYEHSNIGYNYRMSNICAGIGCGQMEVLTDRVNARRAINQHYRRLFKDIKGVTILSEPSEDYYSNYWLTTILIDPTLTNGKDREGLRLALLEKGIESRPLWKPMHLQPIFKDCEYYGNGVAEKLFQNGLCLPSGSNLTEQDLQEIDQIIISFFQG